CEKCAARGLRERRFRFLETTLTSCTQPCKKRRIPKQVRFNERIASHPFRQCADGSTVKTVSSLLSSRPIYTTIPDPGIRMNMNILNNIFAFLSKRSKA
ncbi:MAG: hypothetical protein H7834_13520, partial [Magnetococcus sp. YQC-9]